MLSVVAGGRTSDSLRSRLIATACSPQCSPFARRVELSHSRAPTLATILPESSPPGPPRVPLVFPATSAGLRSAPPPPPPPPPSPSPSIPRAGRVPLPVAFCSTAHLIPPCDGNFCLQPAQTSTAPALLRAQPPIMTDRKAVIKNADMSEDMQQDAIDCATQALEKYNIEKDIAAFIKKEFDKKYNPTWHCIVGRNFGSYVTHETKHFIYFYLGQVAILLFKSG